MSTSLTTQMGAIQQLEVPHTRAHLPRHFEILAMVTFTGDQVTIMYKSGTSDVVGMRQVVLEATELGNWKVSTETEAYLGGDTPLETGRCPSRTGRRNGAVPFHLVEGHGVPTPGYDRKTYAL